MFYRRTPTLVQKMFKGATWRIEEDVHNVFLTFDDGPHPESTPKILSLLDRFGAQATFFCQGISCIQYPELVQDTKNQGHTLANHGFKHLSGWKTDFEQYVENAVKGAEITQSALYRPPYGQLTWRQYSHLKNLYQLIFWEVMPGDFQKHNSADDCARIIKKHTMAGSIIVLHDSPQYVEKVLECLEIILPVLSDGGMTFSGLGAFEETK